MRNTRRTNSRKPHAKKHDRALTKRKHIAKRTMKGGALQEVGQLGNNRFAKFGERVKFELNLDTLQKTFPDNTICKDTVNNFWELKYFTLSAEENITDSLIADKIGKDTLIFASKLDNICLNSNTEYYRKLVNSGLVNFITLNPNYNPRDNSSKKYILTPSKQDTQNAPKLYVYNKIIPLALNSETPNTGSTKLKFEAKDDAAGIRLVKVSDIATGKYAMPFLHVYFALKYYSEKCNRSNLPINLIDQLETVYQLSRMRNHRIMRLVNTKIDKLNENRNESNKYYKYKYNLDVNDPNESEILSKASELGVSVDKYMDTIMDAEEAEGCSNNWNLNQKKADPEKRLAAGENRAADNVCIITDLDGEDWLILIIRKNAPGFNNLAWPGGFVDNKESFGIAALRELDEEVGGASNLNKQIGSDVIVKKITTQLDEVQILDWDPRIQIYAGMKVGGTVHHHYFFPRNANNTNSAKMRTYKCATRDNGNNAK